MMHALKEVPLQDQRPKLRAAKEAPPEDLIPIAEAADLAERTVDTIRRWIKKRRLRAWRKLGLRYVSRADVEAELEYVPEEPK